MQQVETEDIAQRSSSPTTGSAARQPLTFEQIATMKDVSAPQMSPDGNHVVFVVREASKLADKDHEHEISALWIADFAGEARQFTSGLWNDEVPRWSPDGTRIAFLSDRAECGKASVYLIDPAGGEAQRVFDEQGEMANPQWSPDGRYLAVLFTDPETEEEKKRKEDKDDVKVWDTDFKYQRIWVIDLAEKSATAVSPDDRQVHHYAWSPDSSRIAFNSSATPNVNDIFEETVLAIVPREGGDVTTVLTKVGATDDLVWSSDGERIAFRGHAGKVVHEDQVWVVPASGGELRLITAGYRGSGMQLAAVPGQVDLLFVGAEGISFQPYWLSWDGSREPVLSSPPSGWTHRPVSLSADGQRMALAWQSGAHAPNLWVVDTATSDASMRKLTSFSPDVESAALGQQEQVCWTSDEGVTVEGVLVKPYGYAEGQRYPLVVQVHGGPTWAWSDWFYGNWHDWAQMLAGRGYAVLMPNPRGSTARGTEFMDANYDDIGGGEFRDMMAGVDALIERGIADPERLGVGGWSWGGYMTAWTISQTTRFKAAVMGAGLPNMVSDNSVGDIPSANLSYFEKALAHDPEPYWERSAIRYIRNATTPTLILHGQEDRRVHPAQGQELYVALKTLGIETQLVTYPREGHGIRERKHQLDLMQRVVEWFDRHLKDGSDGNE
jgi:dipeptidyl aminopeptidase/acylaminoacyl peptidase